MSSDGVFEIHDEVRSDRDWREVDRELRGIAKRRAALDAEEARCVNSIGRRNTSTTRSCNGKDKAEAVGSGKALWADTLAWTSGRRAPRTPGGVLEGDRSWALE